MDGRGVDGVSQRGRREGTGGVAPGPVDIMATFNQKRKLLEGLLAGDEARTAPFYITLDVTRRCNLTCSGCRFHSPEVERGSSGDLSVKDMPFDMFERLSAELKAAGTNEIIFIGEGEPFLHPRLFDIVGVAKGAGLKVKLLTNGTLLDDENIRSLIESRADILKVSIWASSPDEFAKNHPGTKPEYFARIVEGLKNLSRAKGAVKSALPRVYMHQPLNRNNFRTIDAMALLAAETGCDYLSFSPLKTLRGELDASALTRDEEEGLSRDLFALKPKLASLGLGHNIDDTLMRYRVGKAVWEKTPCYMGWIHARIKVDGAVFPCQPCDLPMGNLNESGFFEIWNNPRFRAFRTSTITRRGLTRMMERHCDCLFCCFAGDNLRIHRIFRWLAPLRSKAPGAGMKGA